MSEAVKQHIDKLKKDRDRLIVDRHLIIDSLLKLKALKVKKDDPRKKELIDRQIAIDKKIRGLNAMIKATNHINANNLTELLLEVFPSEVATPAKVENQKDEIRRYRTLALKSIDQVISLRKLLTSVIQKGCEQFDKGYFMQVVSPINRALPPVTELEKLKRINNL